MMPITEILNFLIMQPLKLVFEFIYTFELLFFNCPHGIAIIGLSIFMNFALLPMYNNAERIQKENDKKQKEMQPFVSHIKKTFRGAEQTMMLQTYYKENDYKMIYTLKSSLSLLIQIPFFMVAYRFLSNLALLKGEPFGPIQNLAQPDGLLVLGNTSINVLPILMTIINIIAGAIYAKNASKSTKIQIFGLAILFLIILYNSPSALVLYWTCNNIFSLFKNIVLAIKEKHPTTNPNIQPQFDLKYVKYIFIASAICMAIITGLFIPTMVMKSSPSDYIISNTYVSPLIYIVATMATAIGTFVIWPSLFYYVSKANGKLFLSITMAILSICAIVNYMGFATDLGNLSSTLKYDIAMNFSVQEMMINIAVLLGTIFCIIIIFAKLPKIMKNIIPIITIALVCISTWNIVQINTTLQTTKQAMTETTQPREFHFSTKGKNVVVLMLDRAVNTYIPFIFQENPTVAKQFEGFTWYPNTLSYGLRTNTASAALFGGYEYLPEKINARNTESLESKQNEALKIMPVLFDKADFEVTVCDPPYAGYTSPPNLSIYNEYPDIKTFNTDSGQFINNKERLSRAQAIWKHNLFGYSFMRSMPLIARTTIYLDGNYCNLDTTSIVQTTYSVSKAEGITQTFMNSYTALCKYPEITKIYNDDSNHFLMIENSTTHNVMLLSEPTYEPMELIDNTEYDTNHQNRFTYDNLTLPFDTAYQMSHYQSNMAALMKIGDWLDYLRQNDVYDNTRIIIVADHGWALEQRPDMMFGTKQNIPTITIYNSMDAMGYNPLLMVKDFNSTEFKVDDTFMTNADTPLLAMNQIIDEPVNPFTNNPITDTQKYTGEQHIFYTDIWGVDENNGNTFLPGLWYKFTGFDIFDKSAWSEIK